MLAALIKFAFLLRGHRVTIIDTSFTAMVSVSRSAHGSHLDVCGLSPVASALSKSHESRLQGELRAHGSKEANSETASSVRMIYGYIFFARPKLAAINSRRNVALRVGSKFSSTGCLLGCAHPSNIWILFRNLTKLPPNDKRIIQPFRKLLIRARKPAARE